jgi:hypothetical protein
MELSIQVRSFHDVEMVRFSVVVLFSVSMRRQASQYSIKGREPQLTAREYILGLFARLHHANSVEKRHLHMV